MSGAAALAEHAPAVELPMVGQGGEPVGAADDAGPTHLPAPKPVTLTRDEPFSSTGSGPPVVVQQDSLAAAQDADPDPPPNACHRWWDGVEPWVLVPERREHWLCFAAVWTTIVGLAVFFVVWAFPRIVDSAFDPAVQKIEASLTRVQIGVIITLACLVLPWTIILPPSPAIWLAAVVFSFGEAFAMVMVGSTLSMAPPFLLVRHKVGGPLLRFLQRYKRTNAILLSVQKAGPFTTVLIIRLGPVPNSLANYLLGLPKALDFWRYMAASTLGIIPSTAVAVIFGRNIKGLADMLRGESVPAAQIAVNLVSLFAGIALLIGGYIYAKRVLDEMEREAAAEQARLRAGGAPPPPHGAPFPVVVHAVPLPLPPAALATSYPLLAQGVKAGLERPAADAPSSSRPSSPLVGATAQRQQEGGEGGRASSGQRPHGALLPPLGLASQRVAARPLAESARGERADADVERGRLSPPPLQGVASGGAGQLSEHRRGELQLPGQLTTQEGDL